MMNQKQKAIITLYYSDKFNDPQRISDCRYSLEMDLEQMLLLMEGIFGEREYVYSCLDNRVRAIPTLDKDTEYKELVVPNDGFLNEAGIINIDYDIVSEEKDYKDIIDKVQKKMLFFLDVLMNTVNGKNRVKERNSFLYYCMYSYRGGKEFLIFLIFMEIKFLMEYIQNGISTASNVLELLNNEYLMMKENSKEAKNFLDSMVLHATRLNESTEEYFFSQCDELYDWKEKISNESNIWHVIFSDNRTYEEYSFAIMKQIRFLSEMLIGESSVKFLWEDEICSFTINKISDFYFMNNLIEELQRDFGKQDFTFKEWCDKYIKQLYKFISELMLI